MTDLDKYIDRINTARKNNFITPSEAESLRKLARSQANSKGDFGPRDRDVVNAAFKEALNKRGSNALNQGRLPVGVTPDKPLPSPRPNPTPKPTPTPKPDSERAGFDKWVERYDKLGTKDQQLVTELVKGNPTSFAMWKTLGTVKRKALRTVVSDKSLGKNDITKEEAQYLRGVFKGEKPSYPQGPEGGKGEGGEGEGPPGSGEDDDSDGGGGDEGGGAGGSPDQQRQPRVEQGTTEKIENENKKFNKIKFPSGGETNKFIPSDSERIFMPNIESKITKKIERITLDLVDFTREFIEAGQDYRSIDYIPLQEVFDENDVLYFVGQDPSSPMATQEDSRSFVTELINDLVQSIRILLSQGDESNPAYTPRPGPEFIWYNNSWFFFGGSVSSLPSEVSWTWNEDLKMWVDINNLPPGLAPGEEPVPSFNYAKFLELFSLSYTESGDPVYTFNIELDDGIIPGVVELTTQYNSVDIEG